LTGFCDGGDEPSRSVRGSLLNISATLVCGMEISDLIDYLVVNDVMHRSQLPRGLRAWVCGSSLAEIVGSYPAGGVDVGLL
jgi:hypothetical protein